MDKRSIIQASAYQEISPLTYPYTAPQSAAELVEITADLKWLRLPMPYALDHVNAYLLRVDNGWLLIDTGLDSPTTRALWEEIFSGPLKGESVAGIYCTHYHVDHAGLAGYLAERWRVPLYMSYEEYFTLRGWPMDLQEVHWQHAEFFRRAGLPDELLSGTLMMFGFSREISPPPPSFVRLRHGNPLAMAGDDWHIISGEGHSPEHALLYSAQRATLFSGDQLLPRITTNVSVSVVNPLDEPLSCWFASLGLLAELPDDVLVLPGHGLPFRGARARVSELFRHHEGKLRVILAACTETALNAYELVQILYPRTLSTFELQLALGECLAHLHYLLSRGGLTKIITGEGVVRYRYAPELHFLDSPDILLHKTSMS